MISDGQLRMPDLCNRRNQLHFATGLNLLIKTGVDLNQVDLLPVGKFENYKGEILKQEPPPGTPLSRNTRIVLEIGCSGATDKLPYQFFYGLEGRRSVGSAWEDRARRLMAPFDNPEIKYEAFARRQTLKFNFSVPDKEQLSRFLDLFDFGIENASDHKAALLWATILPDFHRWAGNPDKAAEIMSRMFGYRFRIIENIRSDFEIPEEIRYRLGSKTGRLGKETVLGKTFIEYDSAYRIIVSGIAPGEIAEFLPGGKKRKKVEWVLNICMPSNLDYRITFETDAGTMHLGDRARLGYSTRV